MGLLWNGWLLCAWGFQENQPDLVHSRLRPTDPGNSFHRPLLSARCSPFLQSKWKKLTCSIFKNSVLSSMSAGYTVTYVYISIDWNARCSSLHVLLTSSFLWGHRRQYLHQELKFDTDKGTMSSDGFKSKLDKFRLEIKCRLSAIRVI